MENKPPAAPPSVICYHRRSKSSSHKNKNGGGGAGAAAAESLDPRRKGLLKNSEKPVIYSHWRGESDTSRDEAAVVEEKRQQQQQIVSPMGKKRKIMSVLPDDIIHNEILTRLPAKYLVQFRLVSKSWNSLLFNSEFVKSHLARLHSYPDHHDEDLIIAKTCPRDDRINILSHTNIIEVALVPRFYGFFLGSINGLVCMSSRAGRMFRLWNPATAQLKQFFLPSQHPKGCDHFVGGFSWDSMQNDYKVVLVCYDTLISSPSLLLIYSTNSATWTQLITPHSVLPNSHIYKKLITRPPSTIVKGTPYWRYKHYLLLPGKKRRRRTASVFKFMPEINEFRLLPDLDIYSKKFNIVNINESLFGMTYKRGCKDSLVDIYSLDEETESGVWSKMYTIGPINLSSKAYRLSQCFKNGGEILISQRFLGGGSFYDCKTKQTTVLGGEKYDFKRCFSYTPSLVCVQGMVSIEQFLKNKDNEISDDDLLDYDNTHAVRLVN